MAFSALSRNIETLALALVVLVTVAGCAPQARATFRNPIEAVGQDPDVIQSDGRYLLTEERNDDEIWIVRSRRDDLTGVVSRGAAHRVWTAPARGSHCTDIWAPELHRIGSHWFIYYSATTCDGDDAAHRMFVLESAGADPLGRYVDRGVVRGLAARWSIDGTEFTWRDRAYFAWSGWPDDSGNEQDLYIARMSGPIALETSGTRISRPQRAWERHGAPIEEGPEALVHGSTLFLVYSASGSWTDDYAYGLLRLVGTDPLTPSAWVKSSRSVFHSANGVYGTGHGSFVTSPDGTQHWMIYHSAIAEGSGWEREVDAKQFTWRADGQPDFGAPTAETTTIEAPSGQMQSG